MRWSVVPCAASGCIRNAIALHVSDLVATLPRHIGETLARTAGLRVPTSSPEAMRVENRLPGADANPYLAIAASLLCGYIGMVEGHNPSAPVVGRGYERRNLRLPLTIEDALERMENSATIEKYLGKNFITGYVAVKRAEHENFKRVISSWEREFLLFAV